MNGLPSGTVTFLFTDIEGSTVLWERYYENMSYALARHNLILSDTIAQHNGYVFKTVGDAFCAAFSNARDAALAAVDAQKALQAEMFSNIGNLRVRMALHTGITQETEQDYFGPVVNRVARLLAVGHGGQILFSHTTQQLVRDLLPKEISFHDFGERRLKDLTRPERVFQLITPELPAKFPPIKTLDAYPNNLPIQPTLFVGRVQEIEQLKTQLTHARLVTLTGPGGIGKTRLAMQVAAELLDEFRDGVVSVSLAPISVAELVKPTIAEALGIVEADSQELLEKIKGRLHDRQMLLLVDNFEHVHEAAPLIVELLAAAPQLKVLVTSRSPLHVSGEHDFSVPPLPLLDRADGLSPDHAILNDAVRLFVDRAKAAQHNFQLTTQSVPVIAEICKRVDGIPLAIELAAARIKIFQPVTLLARLDQQLKLLVGGPKNLTERHQTLTATIDWSYQLLDETQRKLLRWLSVFAGGAELQDVEAVCSAAGTLSIDILDGVSSLVDKSVLRQVEGQGGESRFLMLRPVREFALAQLEQHEEAEKLRQIHAEHYLTIVMHAKEELIGQQQGLSISRLDQEYDNIRAVLTWATSTKHIQYVNLGLQLAGSLWRFWEIRGYLSEGRNWLETMIAHSRDLGADQIERVVLAQALDGAGALADCQGDYNRATVLLEEALSIWRAVGDKEGMSSALNGLGLVRQERGLYAESIPLLQESLALRQELHDTAGCARVLNNLGNSALLQTDYKDAERFYKESLDLLRPLGDTWGVARALNNLGMAALHLREHERAAMLFMESLDLFRKLDHKSGTAHVLSNLGRVRLKQDHYNESLALYKECLALFHDLEDQAGIAECLEGWAALDAMQGSAVHAARLLGAADTLRQDNSAPLPPADLDDYNFFLAVIRDQIDPSALDAAWLIGSTSPRAIVANLLQQKV